MASSTLVTGGDGFVGRHLVSRLIEENSKVVILDNFASGSLNRVVEGAEVDCYGWLRYEGGKRACGFVGSTPV